MLRWSQKSARNARNAQECGLRSFHEPFHGIPGQARPERSVTVSDERLS
jgi:hypothetical protein